ncbi:MAG: KOW domain-containing RNA-binding protein [Defluviitaleaceae bacterium]|nr:KOW domain-containing RNA-binding protein [Defluviitaleaceae bacterium]MCL2836664.1 KOW domain-containing RNA-binding protein [Defluviitaleaceae bacterium]
MADIHELSVGQIVFSKSGRDRGKPFIIVAVEGNYVRLADGKLRSSQKPKLKKRMHIQPVKCIDEELRKKITERSAVSDAELRKALETFLCDK